MQKFQRVNHEFPPVFDKRSRVLMLGTMPSPKSRKTAFTTATPETGLAGSGPGVSKSLPQTREEKISFALEHKIAVWDVLASCDICGADDGSIQNPVPNDMSVILEQADIQAVFATGAKAYVLYKKYCREKTQLEAVRLPSTSPANCRISLRNW